MIIVFDKNENSHDINHFKSLFNSDEQYFFLQPNDKVSVSGCLNLNWAQLNMAIWTLEFDCKLPIRYHLQYNKNII